MGRPQIQNKGGVKEGDRSRGSDDVSDTREAVQDQFAALGSDAAELGRVVSQAVKAELSHLREKGVQVKHRLEENLGDVEGTVSDAVRSSPIRSLAIAAGVGLVIGMIARR